VPPATRGSSASAFVLAFNEHCASVVADAAHVPNLVGVPVVSRTPWAPLPTATQCMPPSAEASATPLAANTISLDCSWLGAVVPVASFSYQTTHGTESCAPVKAMSGSTPLRVGSMFSVGSALPAGNRSIPVCCQQKPPRGALAVPPGVTPKQLVEPGPMGRSTKIWSGWIAPTSCVDVSCHVIQGPGFVGSGAAAGVPALPPATDGFSASWAVWMLSEGTGTLLAPPLPRPCPANTHLFWVASNRLAKTLLAPNVPPTVFSYHVAHGTVRPAPAKSMAGASPFWPWSKFSEPLGGAPLELPPTVPFPRVVQAPPANERENT
jgi:hypothetical protein